MMQTLKQTMMVVVESLINKFEEDQLKKEEMDRKIQHEQSSNHYTDNCSDSDSSFNQVVVELVYISYRGSSVFFDIAYHSVYLSFSYHRLNH